MKFSHAYEAAFRRYGVCPIESGQLLRLADDECKHGRLPGDRTPACGCWPQEGAAIVPLPTTAAPARAAALTNPVPTKTIGENA